MSVLMDPKVLVTGRWDFTMKILDGYEAKCLVFLELCCQNKLPGLAVGSFLVEAFKSQLDKAMARDDLVLAGDWTRDF